ncbi:hypothetical protein ACFX5K_00095 [Rickettsiales bacterium LUAb2]
MINPQNLMVVWGDYQIHDMFNIISSSDIPSEYAFTYKLEIMPNGKSRQIATTNNDNIFSLTVARDGVKAALDTLKNAFNNQEEHALRLINKVDGEVLADFEVAMLANYKGLGAVEDGKGNDIVITWSCINEA